MSDLPRMPLTLSSAPENPEVVHDLAEIPLNRPSRPMLAREADSMYWMSRYVERAEHIARVLHVHANLLADVGELAPRLQAQQWQSVLAIFRLDPGKLEADGSLPQRVAQHMAFGADNPNSIASCIASARENARGIRESISAEMWEQINTLYWYVRSEEAANRFEESPDDFYRYIMGASMLFHGVTDQAMGHDQRWNFTQLGTYLERIDVTCRVIETRLVALRASEMLLETPLRNILWMAALRCCCSIENYRRTFFGDLDPLRVASYLLLQRDFPRTVRYAVDRAHESIASIRRDVRPGIIDPAERILGRLQAQLEYAEPTEIVAEGLPPYLQRIQEQIAHAAAAIHGTYFH